MLKASIDISFISSLAASSQNYAGAGANGAYLVNVENYPIMTLGLYSPQDTELRVEQQFEGSLYVWFTAVLPASKFNTVLDLPAPLNASSFLVVPWPVIRIRLKNLGASTAAIRFQARFFKDL